MAPLIQQKTAVEKEAEEKSVSEAAALSPKLIYEIIRRDGEEELERSKTSLMWSGVAAGMLISLSVLGEAIFRTYLPDTPHRYLIENLGYSLGFLAVIMGRMQLFTENTITTFCPSCMRVFGALLVLCCGFGGLCCRPMSLVRLGRLHCLSLRRHCLLK